VERDIIIDFEKKEMMKHGDFLKSHVKGGVLWWFSIVDMIRMRWALKSIEQMRLWPLHDFRRKMPINDIFSYYAV